MASSVDICPVCLQRFGDARVLPCLHNMCKACVDRMAVTATDGVISCSVCRTSATLPPNGAAGLPKDVSVSSTHASDNCGLTQCGMCDDDKTRKKPTMWCKQCRLPLCNEHTAPHVISASSSGEVHIVVPLSMAKEDIENQLSVGKGSTPKCVHHGEALKFHCGTCDVAICGSCTAIGDHKKHDGVRLIKDILKERKTQVSNKVDTLEKEVVPKLERSLQAVDNVSTELTRRADEVRTDIRKAGKQAVEMVEAHVEQMVQEVDDLELSRCKVLDRQRDELKSHLDEAKNAIQFRDRMMTHTSDSEEEAHFSILHALKTRTEALITTHIKEEPQHHSNLEFKAASDGDLAIKTKEGIGKVIPCQASARHCQIEGSATRIVQKGKPIDITIRAKDRNGDFLTTGGDTVSSRWVPMVSAENTPRTTIVDNNNGTYTASCVCPSVGTFHLEVYVNAEKIAMQVKIACTVHTDLFDPAESHPSITISEDEQKASLHTDPGDYVSVLGKTPMRSGEYTWRVKISNADPYCQALGIAPKPLSPQRKSDHQSVAYCLYTNGNALVRDGINVPPRLPGIFWKPSANDTFQLDLNCDRHTLQIKNLRSGESTTFSNLPDKEYFQFVSMMIQGQSMEFIE